MQHTTRGSTTAMRPSVQQHRFTVEEFLRIGETGILDPDLRVELLDGKVYEMAAIGSPHAACVNRLTRIFTEAFRTRLIVAVQNPVQIGRYTLLVPDVTLLQPRDDYYEARHPRPEDVLLLVEVADTTLSRDRRVKMPVYGRAGVVESWLVDLNARRVQVFREPSSGLGYERAEAASLEGSLTPISLPDLTVDAAKILG